MVELTIEQGTTRAIRVTDIVDAAGNPLTVTGWTVHAQIRPSWDSGTVYAEWSSSPTGDQGLAEAEGTEVILQIPHDMSSEWDWDVEPGQLHVEITEPGPDGRRERLLEAEVYIDHEVVRP